MGDFLESLLNTPDPRPNDVGQVGRGNYPKGCNFDSKLVPSAKNGVLLIATINLSISVGNIKPFLYTNPKRRFLGPNPVFLHKGIVCE